MFTWSNMCHFAAHSLLQATFFVEWCFSSFFLIIVFPSFVYFRNSIQRMIQVEYKIALYVSIWSTRSMNRKVEESVRRISEVISYRGAPVGKCFVWNLAQLEGQYHVLQLTEVLDCLQKWSFSREQESEKKSSCELILVRVLWHLNCICNEVAYFNLSIERVTRLHAFNIWVLFWMSSQLVLSICSSSKSILSKSGQ